MGTWTFRMGRPGSGLGSGHQVANGRCTLLLEFLIVEFTTSSPPISDNFWMALFSSKVALEIQSSKNLQSHQLAMNFDLGGEDGELRRNFLSIGFQISVCRNHWGAS